MRGHRRVRRLIFATAVYIFTCLKITATLEFGAPVEIKLWDTGRTPLSHMVDVTNEFGLKVLAEHNFLNDNNIAFSPYGLMGILVALYEGVDGESSYQIQRAMQLPWNRNMMRIGFRDIHRTLKTYFVPEEGFLAGLALNNENVTFNPKYKKILRFYGFDLENEQLPTLSPEMNITANSTTTLTTTMSPISSADTTTATVAMTTGSTPSRADPTTTTLSTKEETTTTSMPTLNPNVETFTVDMKVVTSTTVNPSSAPNFEDIPATEQAASEKINEITAQDPPSFEPEYTMTTVLSTATTDALTDGVDRTTRAVPPKTTAVSPTTTAVPTTTTAVPPKTTAVIPTTTAVPPTTTEVPPITTAVPPTTTEVPPITTAVPPTTTAVPPTTKTIPPTTTAVPPTTTVVPPTATTIPPTTTAVSPTTTVVPPTATTISPTTTAVPPTTTVVPPTATAIPPTTTVTVTTTTAAQVITTTTTEPGLSTTTIAATVTSTASTPTDIEIFSQTAQTNIGQTNDPVPNNGLDTSTIQISTQETTSELSTTFDTSFTSSTIVTEDVQTETVMTTTSDTQTTDQMTTTMNDVTTASSAVKPDNDSTLETLDRRKRSILDFIFTKPPYIDDYVYYRSFDVGSQLPNPDVDKIFMANGLKSVQVTYMRYDTVLEYAYLPHLEASALRLPLDSDRYYLLVVIPTRRGVSELDRLLGRMARESDLSDVYSVLRSRRVKGIVPSFIVKGHVTLTTDLQKLGIRDVFEPRQRDFTPMTPQLGVYVRSIEQAVSVAIRKYQPDDHKKNRYVTSREPVVFSATYPFLYFVMDSNIHVALMAGKMVDPLNSRIL